MRCGTCLTEGAPHTMAGVVRAYLAMQKITEAAAVAREAYKLTPHNSKVLALYGLVLSHLPHTREAVPFLSLRVCVCVCVCMVSAALLLQDLVFFVGPQDT